MTPSVKISQKMDLDQHCVFSFLFVVVFVLQGDAHSMSLFISMLFTLFLLVPLYLSSFKPLNDSSFMVDIFKKKTFTQSLTKLSKRSLLTEQTKLKYFSPVIGKPIESCPINQSIFFRNYVKLY